MKINFEEYDISYRQFDHWARQGWIRPDGGDPGSGIDRSFSGPEVDIFRIMAPLVNLGFRPSVAAELARAHVDKGFTGELVLRDGRLEMYGIFASVRDVGELRSLMRRTPPEPGRQHFR